MNSRRLIRLFRRRLLNRQVAGVCALENLVHIRSGAPKEPIVARTIGEQTACISEFREAVDSGKSVLQAKVGKFLDMTVHKRIGENPRFALSLWLGRPDRASPLVIRA